MIDLLAKQDPLAVYAALLATAVFVWDVVKWYFGNAHFAISAVPNMHDLYAPDDAPTFITIEVRNTGELPTTITHVVLMAYKTPLHRLLGRAEKNALVNNPTIGNAPPFELSPGGRFMTVARQEGIAVGWSQHYYLYAGVIHTMSRRPLLARIRPLPTS